MTIFQGFRSMPPHCSARSADPAKIKKRKGTKPDMKANLSFGCCVLKQLWCS